jgi:hypothetical protein
MNGKTLSCAIRAAAVALALGPITLAQSPNHLSGLINDFSPVSVNPPGLWEIRGEWSLDLKGQSGNADFSAVLTMDHSDFWLLANPTALQTPSLRGPHTHDIQMENATVTPIPGGLRVSGPATITGNGAPAPFGTESTLEIEITGGQIVPLSNVTLTFGGDATKHFSSQPLHGVVRNPK